MYHLEQVFRIRYALKSMQSKITEAYSLRHDIAHKLLGCGRDKYLFSVCGCQDSGGAIDCSTEIVAIANFRRASVNSHCYVQSPCFTPFFCLQSLLGM